MFSGTVVQSVTEIEPQKIQSMEKLLTRSIRRTQHLKNDGYHVIEKWSREFSDEDRQRAHEFGIESKSTATRTKIFGGRTEAIHLQKTK